MRWNANRSRLYLVHTDWYNGCLSHGNAPFARSLALALSSLSLSCPVAGVNHGQTVTHTWTLSSGQIPCCYDQGSNSALWLAFLFHNLEIKISRLGHIIPFAFGMNIRVFQPSNDVYLVQQRWLSYSIYSWSSPQYYTWNLANDSQVRPHLYRFHVRIVSWVTTHINTMNIC